MPVEYRRAIEEMKLEQGQKLLAAVGL